MYSQRVIEQFQNATNAGELPDADADVRVDNPICGDILQLAIKVDAGKITDARFRAQGCVPAIACGAELVELIRGKGRGELLGLRSEDLIQALGGLPETSLHAGKLAIDALSQAVKTCRKWNTP